MDDYFGFSEVNQIFTLLVQSYENLISNYSYKMHRLDNYKYVYLIEDSFILYIRLVPNFSTLKMLSHRGTPLEDRSKWWEKIEVTDCYFIVFEELSHNEIFKFNQKTFFKDFDTHYNFITYKKFNGKINTNEEKLERKKVFTFHGFEPKLQEYEKCNFEFINKSLPSLELQRRYDEWEGYLYSLIVYEYKNDSQTGYAICYTTNSLPSLYANKKEPDLEYALYEHYIYAYKKNKIIRAHSHNGVHCNETLIKIIMMNFEEITSNKKRVTTKTSFLAGKLQYFIMPIYIKQKDKVFQKISEILAKPDQFNLVPYERFTFDISEYKWKSEDLCLQITKEIFKKNTVIHQHRPFFLKTALGQLSYDIFVCGKNIAIEYQGRQHFEPIEYFGGEESFLRQKERDKIKVKLSKENKIKLITINYWENITKELIEERIKKCEIM